MVYIHVPFCRSFCTYCDFFSEAVCKGRDESALFRRYTDLVCKEINDRKEEIAATAALDTLYIGGGTPSVLPLSCLAGMVDSLGGGLWREFTMEVNPDDITAEYASGLKSLGVNRVSMGVQSLDDRILHWMNRRHDAAGAKKAFATLRGAGFDNISLDVIFGISHLTDATLKATLSELVSWQPEHISAYQLSIEEGSALGKMVEEGKYTEASDEQCRRQYDIICKFLRDAGYEHYEISNWAKPGFRAVHNSAYWARDPYVGIGPGAHSLSVNGGRETRSWNDENISGWTSKSEILSPEDIREERIMLGMRTLEGFEGRHLSESEWFISDTIISDLFPDR